MESFLPLSIIELSSIARLPGAYLESRKERSISSRSVAHSWQQLKATVHSTSVTDKHLTSACNALCAVILHIAQHESKEVRAFAYSAQTLEDLFSASHKAFDSGKNKPGLQVLDALAHLALESPSRSDAVIAIDNIVKKTTIVLLERSPPSHLKKSCIMLLFLLRKASDLVTYPGVVTSAVIESRSAFQQRCSQQKVAYLHLDEMHESSLIAFFLAIVFAVGVTEARSAATKLFSHLCCQIHREDESLKNLSLGSRAIELYINANDSALADLAQNLFPALSNDAQQFDRLLSQYRSAHHKDKSQLLIVLSLLEIGRSRGFIAEDELPALLANSLGDQLGVEIQTDDYVMFQRLLCSCLPQVRLHTLNLLLMSPSTNKMIPHGALQCLSSSMAQLHDETDSYMRGELVSIYKRLMVRLQRSWQSPKLSSDMNTPDAIARARTQYGTFVSQFFGFLTSELSCHVSYTRRILSLSIMEIMLNCRYDYPAMFESVLLVDNNLIVVLLPLLLDAYEDVREIATQLLLQIGRHDPSRLKNCVSCFELVQRASLLSATTNRNDHADGFGRIRMLSAYTSCSSESDSKPPAPTRLIQSLSIESLTSFTTSCTTLSLSTGFPLHGTLITNKHILDTLAERKDSCSEKDLISLLEICQTVWELVQSHLCVDSPESEADDLEVDDPVGPKDLLAYSWRALRDSSLLIQAVLKNSLPTKSLLLLAGNMSFDQLARLRHRGAFSTVAHTFALCCQLVRKSDMPQIHTLDEVWYQRALEEIEIQSEQVTRRSAGLPAVFTALLDANAPTEFRKRIADLLVIARRPLETTTTTASSTPENSLPQVHALNCLKDIILNSRFRVVTETLIDSMLNLAATCFTSSSWAIQNCGLMLFRACITRLNPDVGGGQETMAGNVLDTTDHLSSIDLALHLLDKPPNVARGNSNPGPQSLITSSSDSDTNEAIFASLDLLGRIYIKRSDRLRTRDLIQRQLGARVWHVREQAARLFASLILDGSELEIVKDLLSFERLQMGCNEVHGRLQACRETCRNYLAKLSIDSVGSLHDLTQTLYIGLSRIASISQQTAAFSAIDMVNDILDVAIAHPVIHPTQLLQTLSPVVKSLVPSHRFGAVLPQRALILFEVYNFIVENNSQLHPLVDQILQDDDIALYVMEKLQSITERVHSHSFMVLCFEILFESRCQEVCSLAMRSLCSYFKQAGNLLPAELAQKAIQKLDLQGMLTRYSFNNQLEFSAIIVRNGAGTLDATLPNTSSLLHPLLYAIKFAASDAIDTPTRSAAVEAIAILAPVLLLPPSSSLTFTRGYNLELLVLTYDLLNDDDQDIRWKASSIVNVLVNSWSSRDFNDVEMSTAYAREQLLSFLVRYFSSENTLQQYALRKVLGIPNTESDAGSSRSLERHCRLHPVHMQLGAIFSSAGDLFAEEKQNLYIDEIATLTDWAEVLNASQCAAPSGAFIETMITWIVDGFRSMLGFLAAELSEFTPGCCHSNEYSSWLRMIHGCSAFSFTFNPDVMVIILRLVVLAKFLHLRSHKLSVPHFEELEDLSLRLREICRDSRINPWVVKVIADNLPDQ